ncbi:MAG: META domain-containing protein [Lewinellaceae bacterium]|nr:META domain-containing protein [Phaeodactylibacter sp.]MCB9041115.1 META domain-containing protein [Lewinellaceae bacterium]
MRYFLFAFLLLAVSCNNQAAGEEKTPADATAEVETTAETPAPSKAPEPVAEAGAFQGYEIEGKNWVLSKYTYDGNPERPVGEDPIHIDIKDGRLAGNGGCNDINGQIVLKEDGTVGISGISKTKKLCGGLMIQEMRIIELLEGAKTYKVNLVFLELAGPKGQLTFRNDLN